MKKQFDNISQLQKWLGTAAGIAIVTIGLQSDLEAAYTNITSPITLSLALGTSLTYTDCEPQSPCFVEYEPSKETDPFPDIDYNQFLVAFIAQATFASTGRKYGGYENLLPDICEHEYLVFMKPPEPGFRVGYILVRMPSDPTDVAKLKETLLRKSVSVLIPDGSGEIHTGNIYAGRGLEPY
jgi:hypothetical protein